MFLLYLRKCVLILLLVHNKKNPRSIKTQLFFFNLKFYVSDILFSHQRIKLKFKLVKVPTLFYKTF